MLIGKKKVIIVMAFLLYFLGIFLFIPNAFAAKEVPIIGDVGQPNNRVVCDPTWYSAISSGGRGLFDGVGYNCWACGDCTVCDFLNFATTVSTKILEVIGGLALLMFIWGGISFIIAAGNPEKIEGAKKVLVNAVIGIVLVLGAWEIVHIVIGALAGQTDWSKNVNIFDKKWYDVACQSTTPKAK